MQFQFRIDDANHITFDLQLSPTDVGGRSASPDVVTAVVIDSNLSDLEMDQITDLAGQILDYLDAQANAIASTGPNEEWRDLFRKGLDPNG